MDRKSTSERICLAHQGALDLVLAIVGQYFFFDVADRETCQKEVSKEEAEKVYKVTCFMDTETEMFSCLPSLLVMYNATVV